MAPVKVYLYDLSQVRLRGESLPRALTDITKGMARMLSQNLLGTQLDGVWHTSVVVHGAEYYFGQGVLVARPPGSTVHGVPLEVIDLGETSVPRELFEEYIDGLRARYTAAAYHLLDFNCNTFSDEVAQFLTGRTLPAHITSLPADFLQT